MKYTSCVPQTNLQFGLLVPCRLVHSACPGWSCCNRHGGHLVSAQRRRRSWCTQEDFKYENGLFMRVYFEWWHPQRKRRTLLFRGHLTTLFFACFFPPPLRLRKRRRLKRRRGVCGIQMETGHSYFLFLNAVEFPNVVFTWRDRRVLPKRRMKVHCKIIQNSHNDSFFFFFFFVSRISMAFTRVIS